MPSLYIHIPWCIRKCPYCDFNSHQSPEQIPEKQYVDALIADLINDLSLFPEPEISSIFIGGGTPSLFSARAYDTLFTALKTRLNMVQEIEITLEANPGTVDQARFKDYRQLGINRLSLGIQSFNRQHLKALGRIHDDQQAHKAIEYARNAGFDNLNIDIMHGLPQQSIEEGLADLRAALNHEPEHLSWYQLTIEPNTVFYKKQPQLPSEEEAYLLEEQGFCLLQGSGFERYEISAFAKTQKQAQHNLNYWLFGDYFGIGAGAHGKHTTENAVVRTRKHRQPHDYQNNKKTFLAGLDTVPASELVFEFMLNASRLQQPIALPLFEKQTGLSLDVFLPQLKKAEQKNLVSISKDYWQVTPLGRRFTNNLQAMFLVN